MTNNDLNNRDSDEMPQRISDAGEVWEITVKEEEKISSVSNYVKAKVEEMIGDLSFVRMYRQKKRLRGLIDICLAGDNVDLAINVARRHGLKIDKEKFRSAGERMAAEYLDLLKKRNESDAEEGHTYRGVMGENDRFFLLTNAINAFAVINDIESYLQFSDALIDAGETKEGLGLVNAARDYFNY